MISEALARIEKSCVGIALDSSAKEKTSEEPRWHRVAMNSYGNAVLGAVKAMNGCGKVMKGDY